MSPRCKSGLPVRRKFDGLCYLLGDQFRIVDIAAREDRLITASQAEQALGKAKWKRISARLVVNGFYEHGNYRIEVY